MKDLLSICKKREDILSDFEIFFAAADARITPEAKSAELTLTDADVQQMVNELR
jgi:hypothetical protein